MRQVTWLDRLRYRFDNLMSRGTIALLGALALVSVLLVAGIAVIDWTTGIDVQSDGSHYSFLGLLWMNLLGTLDSGQIASDTGTPIFIASMFVITLGGIFVVSTLIGILSTGLNTRLEELRKGRSFVVEKGHTVILGWSPTILSIISELAYARENQEKCIVVLADQDKVWMEDTIRTHLGALPKTRVVCRTGSPLQSPDLEIVNPEAARAMIIPAPDAPDPDAYVIKTILALVNHADQRAATYHIIAELSDPENLDIAKMVAGKQAQFVLTNDLLTRLTVQTCRQSGLSTVYSDLLSFRGSEIYLKELPELVGKTYGEALFCFSQCALMGVSSADGRSTLNPPSGYVIRQGDLAIVLAEDIATIHLDSAPNPPFDETAIQPLTHFTAKPERTLILGWNHRTPDVIRGLDEYVASRSEVVVVSDEPIGDNVTALNAALTNQQVQFINGSPTNRRTLENCSVENYDHVLVISPSDRFDMQEADAHTMITLLHLRAQDAHANRPFSITSEMRDAHNRELVATARPDDFIISAQLVSLMLAQLAETPHLAPVFDDLFDPEGMEIYLKPINAYVKVGAPVNFYTVLEAARRRGESPMGYRVFTEAYDASKNYGVHLNPTKSEKYTFAENDRLIVVAEN